MRTLRSIVLLLAMVLTGVSATAQPLGTFRWNVAPYCSVLTLNVTQQGAVYTLDGFEEQCGGNARLPAVGIAIPQTNGTVLIGFTTVTEDGGPLHTRASISPATISGSWEDDAGNSGTFVFNPGTTTGGPRPGPAPASIPTAFTLNADGGFDIDGGFATGTIPSTEPGARLMWYSRKAAFRAGANQANSWSDANTGNFSVGLGFGTRASGDRSMALGSETIASGFASLATGAATVASGNFTTAMGFNASTNGLDGAFVYGDNTASGLLTASAANQFNVRASGGTRIFSNSTLTAGVTLAAGGGSWGSVSDANMKEHFRDLDGDELLAKIARMSIREWNYKTQVPEIRHVGPTAQDFHAAFGLGEDPLRIGTIDADGIALRAIQALEARMRALADENAALKARLDQLEQQRHEQR
jgi:hypothetical protein